MYLQIKTLSGEDLGCTPINSAVCPCDGSYGLVEFLNGDTDETSRIEWALIDGIRDQCEPITEDDYDPKIGMKVTFEGYVGEIVGE